MSDRNRKESSDWFFQTFETRSDSLNERFDSDMDKSFDKAFGRAWKATIALWVVIAIANVAAVVGVVWVAAHFLSKAW